MTKHTPGPWAIDEYGSIITQNREKLLVDGVALPTRRTAEASANARLSASAPELLRELQWVRPFIRRHEDGVSVVIQNADGAQFREWLDRVDAVIAKAIGG